MVVCIGYAGYESYDVVLYMARTITKLKKRVLIIDLSSSEAMKNSIKHGLGLDSLTDMVNYRDINYVRRAPTEEELEPFHNGVVLVYYGDSYHGELPMLCQQITVVVNSYPHVISEITKDVLSKLNSKKIKLLIRDIITIDDVDRVLTELKLTITKEMVSYLFLDIGDQAAAIECQVNQVPRFHKSSADLRKYIACSIKEILQNVSDRQIKKALLLAGRGV